MEKFQPSSPRRKGRGRRGAFQEKYSHEGGRFSANVADEGELLLEKRGNGNGERGNHVPCQDIQVLAGENAVWKQVGHRKKGRKGISIKRAGNSVGRELYRFQ